MVGAPTDELVTNAPGARFGPRAIRAANATAAYHLETRVDWLETLRVVDYGDAPVVPADALAAKRLYGRELSHGTPMYRLVEQGHVTSERYVQIGFRGWWPREDEFRWQAERGVTSFLMDEVNRLGIDEVVARTVEIVGEGPAFLTVDIDVLDPAFAPGTGTPEPGGMTPLELLSACRAVAERLRLVGGDVVEVAPTALGDRTALVADRIVREILTGLALRRIQS